MRTIVYFDRLLHWDNAAERSKGKEMAPIMIG